MTKLAAAFSPDEYKRRLATAQSAMDADELDALIVADPSNMGWLTGYDGWSFYVPQAVILPRDGDPFWWGRRQDANGALRTVWMADDRVLFYAENLVQRPDCHPMDDLAAKLADLEYGAGRIGVELDNYYYSAKSHQALTAGLPDATFRDATGLVNWRRAVKSDEELAFMRRAARISNKVMAGVIDRVEPGLRKNDLVAQIYADAIRGEGADWGDYPAIAPLLPSGSDAAAPHLTWDGRPFRKGEATFFEISGCYRRYHAPLCRTVSLGPPSDAMKRAEEALLDGLAAGLEAARPGALAGDVARALKAALAKAGIHHGGRVGYPVGLSYPPDWGERTISFREEDETPLQAGMTFHFMPGLWMEDWGLEITETILIRPDAAAEALCDAPRHLIVKD